MKKLQRDRGDFRKHNANMVQRLHAYAKLGGTDLCLVRLFGPGLGNMLFPWARFVVAVQRHLLRPIAPTWLQIKIGPILRREKDARLYGGLFSDGPAHIGGWRKLALLTALPHIQESVWEANGRPSQGTGVVVFEGMRDRFEQILRDHDSIKEELLRITRPQHKPNRNDQLRRSIVVHVRLGDFSKPTANRVGQECYRLPLAWYVHAVTELRRRLGTLAPVEVFSDGTDEELRELLRLPATKRARYGSSVADLLALSCGGVLVGSASTFSKWASYLGRMPAIWYPGTLAQRLYYEAPQAEVELPQDKPLPQSFVECVTRKLGAILGEDSCGPG